MKMNRRNVLVGLGGIIASGGALLGTGAFSQVEADRTATINTAGDANALLGIDVDTSYNGLKDGGGDVVEINFAKLNDDAITTFDNALTITNNGSEEVELSISNLPAAMSFPNTTFPVTLAANGGSVDLTIEVDLVNNSAVTQDITLTATSTQRA